MGIIAWILVGLVAGVLAKWVVPGNDAGGCVTTTILGIIGAFVGGFVASLFGAGGVQSFDIASILWATVGAVIVLVIYKAIVGRRRY